MKYLLLALVLLVTPAYAETKAQPMKGIISNILSKLQQVTLDDLKSANSLAIAHNNTLGSQCYQAWIQFIEAEQQASMGPDGKPTPLPALHVITDVERAFDLIQALQPTSPVAIACAPFKQAATVITIPLPLP